VVFHPDFTFLVTGCPLLRIEAGDFLHENCSSNSKALFSFEVLFLNTKKSFNRGQNCFHFLPFFRFFHSCEIVKYHLGNLARFCNRVSLNGIGNKLSRLSGFKNQDRFLQPTSVPVSYNQSLNPTANLRVGFLEKS